MNAMDLHALQGLQCQVLAGLPCKRPFPGWQKPLDKAPAAYENGQRVTLDFTVMGNRSVVVQNSPSPCAIWLTQVDVVAHNLPFNDILTLATTSSGDEGSNWITSGKTFELARPCAGQGRPCFATAERFPKNDDFARLKSRHHAYVVYDCHDRITRVTSLTL